MFSFLFFFILEKKFSQETTDLWTPPVQPNAIFIYSFPSDLNPEIILSNKSSIDLTARSGRAALKHRLSLLGFKLTKFEMETAYTEFLELADEKKLLYDEDLYELMEKRNGK